VFLVGFLLASGWSFAIAEGTRFFSSLLMLHRSAGVLVWSVTIARLSWRATFARFPPFPENLPHLIEWAAKASEYALYALLIMQPATGMAHSLLRGRPFDLLGVSVPALSPPLLDLSEKFHDLHAWGAWALAVMVGLHASAALFHHIVLKDDVLESMLPAATRRSR
jgi:superoxide oxidase